MTQKRVKDYPIYKARAEYEYDTKITGLEYKNDYFELKKDGMLSIKDGYMWNGCSPKYDLLGMIIGTPEATFNSKGVPKTYFPSMAGTLREPGNMTEPGAS